MPPVAPDARVHCIGTPRFEDPDLAALAKSKGAADAWLEAFSRHGAKAPARVTGDFAVAARLDDGRSFVAVDRFAIRSMCWRMQGSQLRFAERADTLATSGEDLDTQSLFNYLYFHVIPSPGTVFREVWRVPPGHCVEAVSGQATVTPYWTPEFEEPGAASYEALATEFRALLRDSVAAQLDGTKVGCFLSGGTDSSTIAGYLGRVTGAPAPTFSIGFEAEGYDEMEYSRIAAKQFGTDHHEYYVTPADVVAGVPRIAAYYDQPFGNSSVLPSYYCARLAHDAGIGKLLGGDGGDELFGGNERYAKQRIFGVYDHVPGILRRGLLEPVLAGKSVFDGIPVLSKAASYVKQAMVPMPDRMQGYNLIMRLGIAEVLSPAFLAQVDTRIPIVDQREVYDATSPSHSLVNRMLAFDWRYTLAESDLPKVRGATGLADMPIGFPLLDDRLLAFSSRLPTSYKVKGLKLRWFFKEALRGFLPDAIITKKKHGFGLPFGVWIARDEPLMRLAHDSLRSLGTRGVVRPEFIDVLLRQHLPAHPGYYGEIVWIMMMLEQWLRAHAPDFKLK